MLKTFACPILLAGVVIVPVADAAQPEGENPVPVEIAVPQSEIPQTAALLPARNRGIDILSETNVVAVPIAVPVEQTQDADEMIREQIDLFLKKQELRQGKNPDKKGKHIYTAVETVLKPVSHPDFAKYRVMAYERAYVNALASFIAAQGIQTATDTLSKAFADNSTDAAVFEDDLASGRTKIEAVFEKLLAVGEAKLDTVLRDLGVEPGQFSAIPPEQKKTLLSRSMLRRTVESAAKALGGVCTAQTYFAEDSDGQAAVGIILSYSPIIEGVAEALKAGRKPAVTQTGPALHKLLPLDEPEKMYNMMGTRLLVDENGPVVVSFGQWANSYSGSSKTLAAEHRKAALAQADGMANAELSGFLNQSFTMRNEQEHGEILENVVKTGGQGGMTTEEEAVSMVDIVRRQAAMRTSAFLTGAEKLKEWRFTNRHGHEIVGVVKAYSFASIEEAKKTFVDPLREQGKANVPPDGNTPSVEGGEVTTNFDVF